MVAIFEKNLLREKQKRPKTLEQQRDSSQFDSITNRISFPKLESTSNGFLTCWYSQSTLFVPFLKLPDLVLAIEVLRWLSSRV